MESEYKDRLTIVYLPGLVNLVKTKRIFQAISDGINEREIPNRLVSLNYKSHETKQITGFDKDISSLENFIEDLEGQGVDRSNIGIIGSCYGAHIALKYLQNNSGHAFAILNEPFFDIKSFNESYQMMAKMAMMFPATASHAHLPVGTRGIFSRKIDILSLAKFASKEAEIESTDVPILAFLNNYQQTHNAAYLDDRLRQLNAECHSIDTQVAENEQIDQMTEIVYPFLSRLPVVASVKA